MTANAIFGVIGTMIGGAACFFLGYHCALRWGAADLDNTVADQPREQKANILLLCGERLFAQNDGKTSFHV